jgi:hypothetical protein
VSTVLWALGELAVMCAGLGMMRWAWRGWHRTDNEGDGDDLGLL